MVGMRSHLVRQHHLPRLHVLEHVVGSVQCPHLGALSPNKCGQVDEPQTITVAQQALGPHVWHCRVLLRTFLCQLDLLWNRTYRNRLHLYTVIIPPNIR